MPIFNYEEKTEEKKLVKLFHHSRVHHSIFDTNMMPSSDVTIIIIINVHLIWKYEENKKRNYEIQDHVILLLEMSSGNHIVNLEKIWKQ